MSKTRIVQEDAEDFVLHGDRAWLTVGKLSLLITRPKDNQLALRVEVFPLHDEAAGDAIACLEVDS